MNKATEARIHLSIAAALERLRRQREAERRRAQIRLVKAA